MAVDWDRLREARRVMQQTPNYNTSLGGGDRYYSRPRYKGSAYRANQYRGLENFGSRPQGGGGADFMSVSALRPNRGQGQGIANTGKTTPMITEAQKALFRGPNTVIEEEAEEQLTAPTTAGSGLKTPLGIVKGVADNLTRGARLHSEYKDRYGRAKGHKMWESDLKKMMTGYGLKKGDAGYEGSNQQFYDKYMKLSRLAQDNEKKQFYKDQADTAWRSKGDRLAYLTGFEDYNPGMYSGQGKGSVYGPGHDLAGQLVPGYDRMSEIINRRPNLYGLDYGEQNISPAASYLDPFDDSAREAAIANQYAMDTDPSMDITEDINVEIKPKPPMPEDPYNPYRDEQYDAPIWAVDPYEGIYESPLTDLLYGEELVDATPTKAKHSRHRWLPRDTVGITRMGGGMNALPLDETEDEAGFFEYLPFYSGLFDWNFSPER